MIILMIIILIILWFLAPMVGFFLTVVFYGALTIFVAESIETIIGQTDYQSIVLGLTLVAMIVACVIKVED